ncbi:MAG: hypothetical protein AB8G11_18595 [Saprospiraceae bacterium]
MNEQIPQSQIQKTENGYRIKNTSLLIRLAAKVTLITIAITVVLTVITVMINETVAGILFFSTFLQLAIFMTVEDNTFDIIIDKTKIQKRNTTIILQQIPYLDLNFKVLDNVTKVRIGDIQFRLNDAADITVLTDAIQDTTDLEFYENHVLSDDSETLTFKRKSMNQPRFATFLTIRHQSDSIRFYDLTNQHNWFEIPKNQGGLIQYSKTEGGDGYRTGNIAVNAIKKLEVRINNCASASGQYRRIALLAVEKEPKANSWFNNADDNQYHSIFHSLLRRPKDELINMRDGEKMYELLKNLPSLANIKLEKVIRNP